MRTLRASQLPVAIAVALAVLVAGCVKPPTVPTLGEAQMLPAKDLAYPGATQESRHFNEAFKGRTVDGAERDRPAELIVDYRLPGDFASEDLRSSFETVRLWYAEQLTKDGWTPEYFKPTQLFFKLSRELDGLKHTFMVEPRGSDPAKYSVSYTIRELPAAR